MQNAPRVENIPAADGDAPATLKAHTAAPAACRSGTTLALRYPLDGDAGLHNGLLQALTLCVAEHGDYRLTRDGTLYRDGAPVGRVRLELLPHGDDACHALIAVPDHDGLDDALLALLAEWNLRPYLPVLNRWRDYALDGDIDQKGRRITVRNGKPFFEE